MDSEMHWKVEIVAFDGGEIVKTIPCGSEARAERVELGVLINLDRERYYTRTIVEEIPS